MSIFCVFTNSHLEEEAIDVLRAENYNFERTLAKLESTHQKNESPKKMEDDEQFAMDFEDSTTTKPKTTTTTGLFPIHILFSFH